MRTYLAILTFIACCSGCNSRDKLPVRLANSEPASLSRNKNYSGDEQIDGLGLIAFPAGQWELELFEKAYQPVYVFKRVDGESERLTFQAVSPDNKLSMDSYWDSICMATSEGIPQQLVGEKNVHDLGHTLAGPFVLQRVDDKITCKGATYVYESDTKPNWMSHAFICSVDDSLVICVHASTGVLSPTGSQDIFYNSKFRLATQ